MENKKYNELITHIPICTHKEPKDILIISDDASKILEEIKKYNNINTKVINASIDELRDVLDNSFDVAICELKADSIVIAHINRVTKDDALAVFSDIDIAKQNETKEIFTNISKYFKIAMPFNPLSPHYAILASKEYHPTADIILQRADLTDGYEVYNSDLHVALFAMPTYIKKIYLGYIKN